MMAITGHLKKILTYVKDAAPVPSSGILTVLLSSCFLFGIQTCLNLTPGVFSVGASVLVRGQLHRLVMFPIYHQTLAQLLLNIAALVFLSSSLEKGVGTVRFMFLFLLLSSTTGLLYSFLDLLQEDTLQGHVEGLVPVTLACVALTTMHTKMTRGFLCGVSFPTVALPWVFLIIATVLVPRSVLPCNVIAVLVGWMYGKGWFSSLNMSEARAGLLEKTMPFRWLRSVPGVLFVPASTEERRKTLLPQINPTPGSYPVQAYAPLSSVNPAHTKDAMYEGWPHVTSPVSSPTPPLNLHGHIAPHNPGHSYGHYSELSFGHTSNHTHGHSHGHGHSHDHWHGHSHDHGCGHSHGQE